MHEVGFASLRSIARWIILLLCGLALMACGSGYHGTFRYRLSFAIQINGEVKTASSIIEVLYYGGGKDGTVGASGARNYSQTTGVAPIMDLGAYGMLAAAMEIDGEEAFRRRKEFHPTCKYGASAAALPGIFQLEAAALAELKEGKRELPDTLLPAFIWVPSGGSYKDAQQICPEEFARVIGGRAELRSVTIEVAPDAPLKTLLDVKAPWLDQLRIDQAHGRTRDSAAFLISRYNQLETY